MSYLPRCATCKHWDPAPVSTSGICVRLSRTTAHADAWIADGGPHDDDSGEYSTATLLTRSRFGCTEHEPTVASSPRRSIDMAGNPVSEQDTRTLEKP